jgi:hypothetical protein
VLFSVHGINPLSFRGAGLKEPKISGRREWNQVKS